MNKPGINFAEKLGIKVPQKLDPNLPVLIVEDQQDLRLIVVHHLQKLQFRNVVQGVNGLEAIEKIRAAKKQNIDINIIVCDTDMPVMGGIDLLNEIREAVDINRPAFCLAMDNVSKEKIMLAVENGVDEIITKPFTLGDVVPKIRNAFKIFNNPANPEQVYEFAKRLMQKEDYDKAETVYKLLSQSSPKAVRPLVGLARLKHKKQENDAAFEYLKNAEDRHPKYVHVFSVRGEIYLGLGDTDKAIECYRKAIDLSPLNPIRYIDASKILIEKQKYQEVIDLLNLAVKHSLEFSQLHDFLSQAYFHLKDYKQAIRHIKSALNQDPNNIEFLNHYAIALKATDLTEDAMKAYNKIIKLDPENIRALFNKAILLQDTHQLPEAVKTLQRLVSKHPDFEKGKRKLEEIKKKMAA